jgi:hypothetical protein
MTIMSIQEIASGDPITVKYTQEGYYEGKRNCGCRTCRPDQPPVHLKRQGGEEEEKAGVKKTRRAGVKHKGKRKN